MAGNLIIGCDCENYTQLSVKEWESSHSPDGSFANFGAYAFDDGVELGGFFTEDPIEVNAFFKNPTHFFGITKRACTLVFFNSKYDLHVLRNSLPSDFSASVSGGRYFVSSWKTPSDKAVHVRDLSYFFVGSNLEKVGLTMKCPVKKQEIKDAKTRVLSDAYITGWCFSHFIKYVVNICGPEFMNRGKFPLTPAALTKIVFSTFPEYNLIKRDNHYEDNIASLLDRCQASGGRTEAFVFGDVPCNKAFDVNSLYPSVMKSTPVPTGNAKYIESAVDEHFYAGVEGVYDCLVEVPSEMQFPILPTIIDGKTMYLTGSIKGVWVQPLLAYAVENGCIIKEFYSAAVWTSSSIVFKDYIEKWEAVKVQASVDKDETLRSLAKLMSNSLFGKFGEAFHNDKHLLGLEGLVDNPEFIEDAPLFSKRSNAIIARYITGCAQIVLHKGIMAVHNSGAEVIYVDTDSIKCNVPLLWRCPLDIDDNRYGAWKDETGGMTRIRTSSPKVYSCHDKTGKTISVHHKGVPMRAKFIDISPGVRKAVWSAPLVGKTAWKNGVEGAPWIEFSRTLTDNIVRPEKAKRCINTSTGRSRPWNITEVEQ